MRRTIGSKTRARKSNGGDRGLWVPPSRTRADGSLDRRRAGRIVWSTRVALPAVPTEKK
jgi:hypothetical protein